MGVPPLPVYIYIGALGLEFKLSRAFSLRDRTLLDTSRTRRPRSYYNLFISSMLHVFKLDKELFLGTLKRIGLLRERRERGELISIGTKLRF